MRCVSYEAARKIISFFPIAQNRIFVSPALNELSFLIERKKCAEAIIDFLSKNVIKEKFFPKL